MTEPSPIWAVYHEDNRQLGVAHEVEESDVCFLPYSGCVDGWESPVLNVPSGEVTDYLANDMGLRLCSQQLRSVVETQRSGRDQQQWLPVTVTAEGETFPFFAFHFPEPPNVLDQTETLFSGGEFDVKPVLAKAACAAHRVFCYPKNEGHALFVSDSVKNEIQKRSLTGMEFQRASMSD